jgi:hypothetical protein
VFQDFAAYTPWLIELNRNHLRQSGADSVLVSSETIDNRYPMLDRGRTVLDLLAHYEPQGLASGYVVFRRRNEARGVEHLPLQHAEAALGEWVDVSSWKMPLLLTAHVGASAAGRVRKLAYRLPPLELSVRLADGREKSHRFIDGIGSSGLLLSPYADSTSTVAALAAGLDNGWVAARVMAFKLSAPEGASYYSARVPVLIEGVRFAPSDEGPMSAQLRREIERRLVAVSMAQSASAGSAQVEARDTMVFAHAPATVHLDVGSASRIAVTYGISDGAWQHGAASDGVCFRIHGVASSSKTVSLHERCLLPLEREADRGEMRISLDLGRFDLHTLKFTTECRSTCSWDWSYWKDVELVR